MLSPDIGGLELLIVAAVALIVVGPKDLPLMLRKLGQFIARLRGMAADFRASFDDMARQSELEDLRKEVEAMRSGQYTAPLQDPSVDQVFNDIDQGLKSGEVTFAPHQAAMAYDLPEEPAPEKPARKPRASRAAASKGQASKTTVARTPAAKAKATAPKAVKASAPKAPKAAAKTPGTGKAKAATPRSRKGATA